MEAYSKEMRRDVLAACDAAGRPPRPPPGEEVGFERLNDPGSHLVADLALAGHRSRSPMPFPYTT